MTSLSTWLSDPRALALLALTLVGCGDKGGDSPAPATGEPTGSGTGTGAATGTGTGAATGSCAAWEATYDLTGSVFFINALIDFTITLEEPYDADDTMGPGTVTLYFQDDNGAPGAGLTTVTDFALTQFFVTGNGLASVTTDLENTAAAACGVASGALAADTATWSPAQLDPYCQTGSVSCVGAFCGTSGSPPENSPFVFDNDCGPQPLGDFVFNADKTGFTMAATVVSQDGNQSTSLSLVGTQTSAQLKTGLDPCLCE